MGREAVELPLDIRTLILHTKKKKRSLFYTLTNIHNLDQQHLTAGSSQVVVGFVTFMLQIYCRVLYIALQINDQFQSSSLANMFIIMSCVNVEVADDLVYYHIQ